MSGLYQIRIQGHLGDEWSDWFDGLSIDNQKNGEALLMGTLKDQSALYGVLNRLQTLNVPLLSVVKMVEGNEVPVDPSKGTSEYKE